MHDDFEWSEPDHKADEILFRNVRKHGCHIVGITDADPAFAFSIGLYLNCRHPELIIFGLPSDDAQAVINHVRDHVSDGRKFLPTETSATTCSRTAKFASGKCHSCLIVSTSASRAGSTGSPVLPFPVSR